MNYRILLSLFALVLAIEGSAQITVKRYSVDGSTSASTASSERQRRRRLDRFPTAVKYNVTPLFAGHYPISLEHRFNPYITAEVGLGLTLNNGIDAALTEAALFYSGNQFYDAESRVRPGVSQQLNVKIFPGGNAFDDGFYFALFVQNRRYNKIFAGENQDFVSFKNTFDQGVLVGTQLRSSDRVMVDLSIGLSNRYVNFPIVAGPFDNGTGKLFYMIDDNAEGDGSYQSIGFFTGVKLAYLFALQR